MFHAFSGLKIINCSSLFFNRRDNKAKSNSCTETPFHIANHFCCVLLPHTIKLPPLLIGGYIWVGLTMRKTHIISSISCFQVVRKLMYLWISQKNHFVATVSYFLVNVMDNCEFIFTTPSAKVAIWRNFCQWNRSAVFLGKWKISNSLCF